MFATPSTCAKVSATDAQIRTVIGVASGSSDIPSATQRTTAEIQLTYKIKDCKMSMVRYNLPMSYSEAVRSALVRGQQYKIAFNHYETHSQKAEAARGSTRWNENSRDIKELLSRTFQTLKETPMFHKITTKS